MTTFATRAFDRSEPLILSHLPQLGCAAEIGDEFWCLPAAMVVSQVYVSLSF